MLDFETSNSKSEVLKLEQNKYFALNMLAEKGIPFVTEYHADVDCKPFFKSYLIPLREGID